MVSRFEPEKGPGYRIRCIQLEIALTVVKVDWEIKILEARVETGAKDETEGE